MGGTIDFLERLFELPQTYSPLLFSFFKILRIFVFLGLVAATVLVLSRIALSIFSTSQTVLSDIGDIDHDRGRIGSTNVVFDFFYLPTNVTWVANSTHSLVRKADGVVLEEFDIDTVIKRFIDAPYVNESLSNSSVIVTLGNSSHRTAPGGSLEGHENLARDRAASMAESMAGRLLNSVPKVEPCSLGWQTIDGTVDEAGRKIVIIALTGPVTSDTFSRAINEYLPRSAKKFGVSIQTYTQFPKLSACFSSKVWS